MPEEHVSEQPAGVPSPSVPIPGIYTPPPPVPPLRRSIVIPKGQHALSSAVWQVKPPSALPNLGTLKQTGTPAEAPLNFPAMSLRIDNFSTQWIYVRETGLWVPPTWYGRVMRLAGITSRSVWFETPPGVTPPAVSTTEVAVLVWYEEEIPEREGALIGPAFTFA